MAVVIETTLGDFTIDLYTEERPQTSKNFLKLCKIKYYNFCLFHSVQRNFLAQTGDPTGSGTGGESVFGIVYGDKARYYEAEKLPKLKHTKPGLISMVNCGNNLLGSQFFLTLGSELQSLDEHCVFAEITEGMDILLKLNETICDNQHRPFKDIRITHTVILEDPFEDPVDMVVPSASPEPSQLTLQNGRIGADEEIDETAGMTSVEVEEMKQTREAQARATILEIVGDLPDAELAPPENVLFVCKLNPVTTDDDLEIIFSRFGKVKSCEVIRDHETGDSLQYAFVEFEEQRSCEEAYFKMDNVLIDDRRIHVDFSQSVAKMRWKGKGRGVEYFNKTNSEKTQRFDESRSNTKRDGYKDSRPGGQRGSRDGSQRDSRDRSHRDNRDGTHRDNRDGTHRDNRDGSHRDSRDGSHKDSRDGSHRDSRDGSHRDNRDGSHRDNRDGSHRDNRDGSHRDSRDSSHRDSRDINHRKIEEEKHKRRELEYDRRVSDKRKFDDSRKHDDRKRSDNLKQQEVTNHCSWENDQPKGSDRKYDQDKDRRNYDHRSRNDGAGKRESDRKDKEHTKRDAHLKNDREDKPHRSSSHKESSSNEVHRDKNQNSQQIRKSNENGIEGKSTCSRTAVTAIRATSKKEETVNNPSTPTSDVPSSQISDNFVKTETGKFKSDSKPPETELPLSEPISKEASVVSNKKKSKRKHTSSESKHRKKRKISTSSNSSSPASDSSNSSSSSESESSDYKRKHKLKTTVAKKYYHRGKLVKVVKKQRDSSESESSSDSSSSDSDRKKKKHKGKKKHHTKKIVKIIEKRKRRVDSSDDSGSESSSSEESEEEKSKKRKKRKVSEKRKKKKNLVKKNKKAKNEKSADSEDS